MEDNYKAIQEHLDKGGVIYRQSWVNESIKFKNQTQEQKDKWCSYCGCEGGCNLCKDIPEDAMIVSDKTFEYFENLTDRNHERNV